MQNEDQLNGQRWLQKNQHLYKVIIYIFTSLDYHNGAFPLRSDKNHVFKDFDKRFKLKHKDFYNYTYRPDFQKAEAIYKKNKERILEK